MNRRTFVLVHGAWHGGWCWRRVADLLEARGHKVYTPTLTGLADRSHRLSRDITLETHIDDIVNLIRWESLSDIVLVGHSYAGFVISGVAEKAETSIASIVFLDAFVPDDGQSVVDLSLPEVKAATLAAVEKGEISRPSPPAKAFGVSEKDHAWVESKVTPQPIFVSLQPITLKGARDRVAKKTYVRATLTPRPLFDAYFERLKLDPAWQTYAMPAGHDLMVEMPDRVAEILLESC